MIDEKEHGDVMEIDKELMTKIYDLRRRLHSIPEASMHEMQTKAVLMSFLRENTDLEIDLDILTLAAALIGVTSLIFAAKGNVWAQILMVVFSILYGIISFRFRYWGEMITYLGMTMPMAVWSAITWFKNPSEGNSSEVAIQKLTRRHVIWLTVSTVLVTVVFYYILMILDTPNIVFSTISIVTSFLAAALTMLRSISSSVSSS